jgi:hypothetical protein
VIEGRIFRDSAQSLLHRLPPNADLTPCGVWDVGLSTQYFEDSVAFAQYTKCKQCYQGQDFTDVHTEHCCSKHLCKYGQDAICTVSQGIRKQSYPCETCSWVEEQMEERGEVWQYGIVGEYGEPGLEGNFGGNIDALRPGKDKPKLAPGIKIVRRRVSEWEEA